MITLAHLTAEPHVGLSTLSALIGMGLAAGFIGGVWFERSLKRRAGQRRGR